MSTPVCTACRVRMVHDEDAPHSVWGAHGRTVTNGAEGYKCPRCSARVTLYDGTSEYWDDECPDWAMPIDGTVTPPEIKKILDDIAAKRTDA